MAMTISLETQIILIATYVLVKLLCKFITSLMNSLNFLAVLFLISHSPHVSQMNVVYLEASLPSSQGKLLCLHSGFPRFVFGQQISPCGVHLLSTPRLWGCCSFPLIRVGSKDTLKSAWVSPAGAVGPAQLKAGNFCFGFPRN